MIDSSHVEDNEVVLQKRSDERIYHHATCHQLFGVYDFVGIRKLIEGTCQYSRSAKIDVRNVPNATVDNGMMRQVWYNLISNALKYSGKTENPAVERGSFLQANDVCYYVKDNGVCFSMAYAGKLFGIFQRLYKQDEYEGTGSHR